MLLHEKEMLIPRGKHQDGHTLETWFILVNSFLKYFLISH